LAWDYLTVDSDAHRLYVSHGTAFTVIDLETDTVVGEITGLNRVHGLAVAPKLGLGFISNGGGNNVSVVDLKTLKVTSTVPTGWNPDWIMFEPGKGEVYAFNGSGQSATVFDAATGKVTVAALPLEGNPETAMADPSAGRVYDNIESKDLVAVIDTATHKVVDNWPIAPGSGATGMAIDLAHHRLIIGAAGNSLIVLMDSTNGKVVATIPATGGIDAAAFDPGTQYAFASGGGSGGGVGSVTIAREDGDKLTFVQTLATERGARTMALDPATHKIYLATATGTDGFRVLVYGLDERK
jgi:YVTN family beta-propeller protein